MVYLNSSTEALANPSFRRGEDPAMLPTLVNRRIQSNLAENAPWFSESRTAAKYYRSEQFRSNLRGKDKTRIRLVANFIRRDVDLMVAEVLDAKPVVDPSARNPSNYELGQGLLQILQWTRDEEENWEDDQERTITDCFHIGEGVVFEGWNPDGDGNRGMPICKWLDSRFVLWPTCKDPQKDDAPWVIYLEHELLDKVLDEHPNLEGKVQPENFETFLTPYYATYLRDSRQLSPYLSSSGNSPGQLEDQRVWVRRMWSKKRKATKLYYYRDDTQPAFVRNDLGEETPVTPAIYGTLTKDEQGRLVGITRQVEELWETKVICNELVYHRLSPFDRSKGGHGKYPFAWFSNVVLRDEGRARGEIGFLIGSQDIANEAVSMYLDQLFLANIGYLNIVNGSLAPEEQEKAETMASRPFTILKTNMGYPGPRWEGLNPTTTNLFANAIPLVKDIMDRISGRQDVDRGTVPGYIQSGRAIRALQAKTSLLGTKTKRHIESGLRRATLLRMYNIIQLMRGSRMLDVIDPESKKRMPIFIGPNEPEIVMENQLQPSKDEETGENIWLTADGRRAQMIVLNKETAEKMLFEKIRLTLDTGADKNALDREEDARTVLQTVGVAALPWVAEQMGWTNRARLEKDLEKYDEGQQLKKEMDKIQKQSGLPQEEIMQLLMQAVEQQVAAAEAQKEAGGPAGPGGAPAMPPGMPPGMGGGPPVGPGGPGGPGPVPQGMESMAMAGMGAR